MKRLVFLVCSLAFIAGTVGGATPAPRPNILFAVADDWGYGHGGAYGCRWVKTPAFDRLARQGILFTHAYTPNAKCAPSRACILTGRNSWQLGAACNHYCYFPPEIRVVTESLAAAGYTLGRTGKGWAPGVALTADGKPRQLVGPSFDHHWLDPKVRFIKRNDYAANFAEFLDRAPAGKPWFFWYGGYEPHRPYEYGSGVRVGKHLADIDRVPAYWPDSEHVRNDMLDYAVKVEHFDTHLGRMLDLLERRGLLENTIVIATSDNGPPFPRLKGQEYDNSNRLPLAICWKKGIRAPGRRVDDYMSFIDFAPTFLEAAGVAWKDSGLAASPGRSLFDVFASEKAGRVNPARDHVLLGTERHDVGRPHDWGYPIGGIVKNDMLYLENFEPGRWPGGNPETGYLECDSGATKTEILQMHRRDPASVYWALSFGKRPRAELFDLGKDPDFMRNVAGEAGYRGTERELRRQMVAELKAQDDPRMFGKGGVFEAFPYVDPVYHNDHFYERYMSGEKTNWVAPTDFEPFPPSPAWAPGGTPSPAAAAPRVAPHDSRTSPPSAGDKNQR